MLEGSVQRSGDQVRITARLVDALEGHQLWSDRYDRQFKDVFAIQDEIALNVVSALQILLREGEQARVVRGGTRSVEAWELYLQADVEHNRYGARRARPRPASCCSKPLCLIRITWTHGACWPRRIWSTHGSDMATPVRSHCKQQRRPIAHVLSVDDTNSGAYS